MNGVFKMKKRKRKLLNKKENKLIKYLVVLLLIFALIAVIGFAYSKNQPTKEIPEEVNSIVNQLNEVDTE